MLETKTVWVSAGNPWKTRWTSLASAAPAQRVHNKYEALWYPKASTPPRKALKHPHIVEYLGHLGLGISLPHGCFCVPNNPRPKAWLFGRMPLFVFGARARWQHHSGGGQAKCCRSFAILGQLRPDATKKSDFQTPSWGSFLCRSQAGSKGLLAHVGTKHCQIELERDRRNPWGQI